jgi:transcriptional regulator with XRE-family HTH domain
VYACTGYDVRMHVKTRGGERLRRWLRDKGWKQEDLAERIGTHQTNVSAWMLGRPIPLDKAIAIRRITKLAVEDWVKPADESGPDLSKTAAQAKAG